MADSETIDRLSRELVSLLGTGQQVRPFSQRDPRFDLATAYRVVARVAELRRAAGQTPIGRKIGFTNRSIWGELGIAAPVWNYVFDGTVRNLVAGEGRFRLAGMPEPRIEPELVLHLSSAPAAAMTADDLVDCIDWVAPGFEVVYSIFPDWDFAAADAAAAYGVHGALMLGERLELPPSHANRVAMVSQFSVDLAGSRGASRSGHARNVLGGPVQALKFLVDELARYPDCEPLRKGEIVTTGTLTEAMPVLAGDVWTAAFHGLGIGPLRLNLD